jgi:PTS system nitrogen regulatory IIA component
MELIDLLSPERVQIDAPARSKKRLLELASEVLSGDESELKTRVVYSSLCGRERLGSTALGNGVAIPHGRIEHAPAAVGAFLRLRDPVEFESPDREPVDLVFAMVVPEGFESEHLELLAQLAELFSSAEHRDQLRKADSNLEVLEHLESWQSTRAIR